MFEHVEPVRAFPSSQSEQVQARGPEVHEHAEHPATPVTSEFEQARQDDPAVFWKNPPEHVSQVVVESATV